MKRDMELVRAILLKAEAGDNSGYLEIDGYDQSMVAAHAQIMAEAGLVVVPKILANDTTGPIAAKVSRLTWDGHEFLDSIRNEQVWMETKSTIGKKIGDASLEVVKTVATAVSLKLMGV
ncbi:MAG: DUF2513 domain-containing protein [Armatimonadetes bacterium]|nr:DUF2513 domain-containing protein [Armatimonadota bacterium]